MNRKAIVGGIVLTIIGLSLINAISSKGDAATIERDWITNGGTLVAQSTGGYTIGAIKYIQISKGDVITVNWESGSPSSPYYPLIDLYTSCPAINYSGCTEYWDRNSYGYTPPNKYGFSVDYCWASSSGSPPIDSVMWVRAGADDVMAIYLTAYSSGGTTPNFKFNLTITPDENSTIAKLRNDITNMTSNLSDLKLSFKTLNSTMNQINTSLANAIDATNILLDSINVSLTNAIHATTTLLESINSSLTNAINETNAFLNYINSTFTSDINALNSTLNTNLSSIWASYANLLDDITRLNDQYNAFQEIFNNLALSNNTVTIYQNNTILAQWDAINATLANISSLQTRMTKVESNNATSYNDTAIQKQLEDLQNQLNNTKPITKIVYQNNTAEDSMAKMLGLTGIIIGFAGVGFAAIALRKKKIEEQIPETTPTEALTIVPPIGIQSAPIQQEEPTAPPAIIAPEEQVPTTIEDVFLLYNDGRLLSHQTRRLKPGVDDAILGGMLTAVQSFIQESFSGDDEEAIKTLEYGSMKIIIERHEMVYLATVMSGDEPKNLRKDMRHLLMDIWDSHKNVLSKWDGDTNKLKKINGMIKQFVKGT